MKIIICPKCFTKLQEPQLAYGCASSDCDREAVPTTVADAKNTSCSSCNQPMTMRFCPECGFQINIGEDSAVSLPISLIGTQAAGKSHYLSVLINEIRQNVGKAYNCSLYPLGGDDTIAQYENHYYNPLFVEGHAIPSTVQDIIHPMIYSLVFSKQQSGRICNLTFYDACGENFRNERVLADYNRSVYNSSGIILLIDPSQIPEIKEDFLSRGLAVSGEDFGSQLSRTIALIRKGSGQQDLKDKITIPIAICVTKLDLIRDKLDASSFLRYPSRHLSKDAFDLVDFNACNMELQSLIESWSGGDLINQVKSQFANYGFFGFSSLGDAPDSENNVRHVAPFRVCDPFLWILSKNNIIRSEWN